MGKSYGGLSSNETQHLLKQYGLNILPQQQPRTSFKIILDIIKEPMIALLIIGGCLYLWLGDASEAIMLFVMIGGVSGITFLQERRTENALQSLKAIASPQCRVFRDGVEQTIASAEIVPGDVIKILEGERIAADATVIDSDNASVDESALTGESLPVSKSSQLSIDSHQLTQANQLFSSTLVKSGWLIAKVYQTGSKTQVGKIGSSLEGIQEQPTRIQQETKHIVKIAALLGLLVSLFVVIGMGWSTQRWIEAVLQGIAIAMSMMPEEFPVVLTIFMALGAAKIAKQHVLMRHMPALETLGSATVLCVDKTGTLTRNCMEIAAVVEENNKQDILWIAAKACQEHHDDPMEKAIIAAARNDESKPSDKRIAFIPITPPVLAMANVWQQPNHSCWIAAKGAPETILSLCHKQLSAKKKNEINSQIKEFASKGMRLLAVARTNHFSEWMPDSQLSDQSFHFVGLIGFADPIRKDVPDAVSACSAAGIRTIMITGDYRETAQTIGQELQLLGPDNAITGEMINTVPLKKLKHLLAATSVCARIMPEQKLLIVQALQSDGEIVAMTGDGINDAPALKAANMGIAMGQRGTDVAREAADMVLMDDNFSSIVKAIAEGRLIFDNMRKAIGFVMAVHIPIALMAIVPVLMGLPPLLTPVHVVILEFIIDPACTLVFESEKAESQSMNRPPRSPKDKIFNKRLYVKSLVFGLIVSSAVFIAYFLGRLYTSDPLILRTMAFSTLLTMNCILIASYRSSGSLVSILSKPNKAFWGVIGGVGLFLVAVVNIPIFRSLMHLTSLTTEEIILISSITFFSLLGIEGVKRIIPTS